VTFYGESTGDVLTASGAGADRLIASAGTEVLFQSGGAGGLNTVSGFKVELADPEMANFGPLAMNIAINTQESDGHGGTILTFFDDTRIDPFGIMKVTSNYFA
jgi:hypothetical protein